MKKFAPSPSAPQDGISAAPQHHFSPADARALDLSAYREIGFPDPNDESAPRHISLHLRSVWLARRSILRWAAAGLFTATSVAFAIPSEYVSSARMMPPDFQSGSSLAAQALSGDFGSIAGDLPSIKPALLIGVMRSLTVQDRLVKRFDLKKVYRTSSQETARNRLQAKTNLDLDGKSGIVTFTVADRDPRRAAAIATGYIQELDALMTELSTSSARRERVFLEDRLKAVELDTQTEEANLSSFASNNGAVDIATQSRVMLGSAIKLQGQIGVSESELKELRQVFSRDNIRVRSLQARIGEDRKQQRKLIGALEDADYVKIAPVKDDQPSPGKLATIPDAFPPLRQLPILAVPYADKLRSFEAKETLYERLTTELESAKVQEAREIPSVKILDPPNIPETESFPPRLLIIFTGTLCGAVLGALRFLVAARWHSLNPLHPAVLLAHRICCNLPWLLSANALHVGANVPALDSLPPELESNRKDLRKTQSP